MISCYLIARWRFARALWACLVTLIRGMSGVLTFLVCGIDYFKWKVARLLLLLLFRAFFVAVFLFTLVVLRVEKTTATVKQLYHRLHECTVYQPQHKIREDDAQQKRDVDYKADFHF